MHAKKRHIHVHMYLCNDMKQHNANVQPPLTGHVCIVCSACRAADKAEGQLIRCKALEEAAELAAKEAAARAQARDMNAATKAANDTLLAFRAAEGMREAQLEAAVEGETQ